MRNVKDMNNKEIQDYINSHNHMSLKITFNLFTWLNNDWNILDNKRLFSKILPRLLKPTPHQLRLATDEWNTFNHHLAFNCFSDSCAIINNEADCKNCSWYSKFPKIKQAYEEAIRIKILEIQFHVGEMESESCWKEDRIFWIKETNRDLQYIIKSCSEFSTERENTLKLTGL